VRTRATFGSRLDGQRIARCAAGVLGLLATIGVFLLPAPAALASAVSLTWAGRSTVAEQWSVGANWEEGVGPTPSETLETLIFPRLTSTACTVESATHPCYFSFNDVRGLTAESLQLDDANDYRIAGDQLGVGSGGLDATPAEGTTGEAGDVLEMPLDLTASQTWHVAGRRGGELGENGLLLAGDLTGAGNALTFELGNGPVLYLAENDTEVGPVAIDGTTTSKVVENGVVSLLDGELDSSDGESVSLSHIFFTGSGGLGRLGTSDVDLDVGSPVGVIRARSARLDSASDVAFSVTGEGMTAQVDYSQLVSAGPVELSNAHVEVVVRPPSKGAACPVLLPGRTYTFVSATSLSGSFSNAPEFGENVEIPVRFATACTQKSQTIRIAYHESGTTQTVTGTVEEAAKISQEEASARQKQKEQEEALKKQQLEAVFARAQERATVVAEEARKKQEEAEAAASTAAQGVAGYELARKVPDAKLASTALTASSSGAVTIKVSCPAAETSCAGTVTVRTIGAVSASVGRVAKKGAVLTLAAASFAVAGGRVETVTLHLSSTARKLLERTHGLDARATITAHDPAGATHTTQTTVTLRAAKAGRTRG